MEAKWLQIDGEETLVFVPENKQELTDLLDCSDGPTVSAIVARLFAKFCLDKIED
jgi:hypothetical protein